MVWVEAMCSIGSTAPVSSRPVKGPTNLNTGRLVLSLVFASFVGAEYQYG